MGPFTFPVGGGLGSVAFIGAPNAGAIIGPGPSNWPTGGNLGIVYTGLRICEFAGDAGTGWISGLVAAAPNATLWGPDALGGISELTRDRKPGGETVELDGTLGPGFCACTLSSNTNKTTQQTSAALRHLGIRSRSLLANRPYFLFAQVACSFWPDLQDVFMIATPESPMGNCGINEHKVTVDRKTLSATKQLRV